MKPSTIEAIMLALAALALVGLVVHGQDINPITAGTVTGAASTLPNVTNFPPKTVTLKWNVNAGTNKVAWSNWWSVVQESQTITTSNRMLVGNWVKFFETNAATNGSMTLVMSNGMGFFRLMLTTNK